MEYKKITITLPQQILKKYKEFCEENGMKISNRIAILIKKDLETFNKKSFKF